jgi:peroxiredoxin
MLLITLMRKASIAAILFIFSSIISGQSDKGYDISVTLSGLADSTIYLAYHLGDRQYLKDTIILDKTGHGQLKGSQSMPEGIYMIVLPGKKYFEVLISDDQYFSLTCSYADYIKTLKFTGSAENSAFIDYQRKWVKMQETMGGIYERMQKNKQNSDSLKVLGQLRDNQEKKMKAYLDEVIESNKGSLLALLVRSIKPVDVPEFKIPSYIANQDSVRRIRTYLYNKDHYFDNINLTDERILRTPILQAKLENFFKNVVIQLADSINLEIDRLMAKCTNIKVYQFVAGYLFNHFRESDIMGHDAVIVKLADDIYLSGKADWTTKEWRDNLSKEVDRIRPNLIGVKAHDLVMNSYNGVWVSLYDLKKDFIVLYFWEPNCSHCQEATPKLKEWYDKVKNQGIEVFTVCTQPDRAKWEKYIVDNKLTWINGWDPQRATNFDYYYNVQSTPGVYILDKNKIIIAKKLPVESIGSFIDNYRKYNKK